jgi:hypothetical protein
MISPAMLQRPRERLPQQKNLPFTEQAWLQAAHVLYLSTPSWFADGLEDVAIAWKVDFLTTSAISRISYLKALRLFLTPWLHTKNMKGSFKEKTLQKG